MVGRGTHFSDHGVEPPESGQQPGQQVEAQGVGAVGEGALGMVVHLEEEAVDADQPAAVYEKAKQLARKHTSRLGSRTLDIVHVASALALGAEPFYTFDANQGRLARLEGLGLL